MQKPHHHHHLLLCKGTLYDLCDKISLTLCFVEWVVVEVVVVVVVAIDVTSWAGLTDVSMIWVLGRHTVFVYCGTTFVSVPIESLEMY